VSKLRDVMAYICKHYPHQDELSNARVTKMVYLADWKSAITRGEQITDTRWTFNHYGPFVYDVIDTAREDPAFEVTPTQNMYGSSKELIRVRDDVDYPSLEEADKEVLDFVIEKSADKNYSDFMHLVYSTYPVAAKERFSELNLVELAEEYEQAIASLEPGR
jgi:hypothetical protein